MKKIIAIIAVLIVTFGIIGFFQYKPILENRLEIILEGQGLSNVHVEIARIGFGGARLAELRFGEKDPLVLENIALNYSWADLKQGRLDEILFENIAVKVEQLESGWSISGLGSLDNTGPNNKNPLSFLEITAEQIDQIPFQRLAIEDSRVEVDADFGNLRTPINIIWDKTTRPNLTYNGDEIILEQDALNVTARAPHLNASFDEGLWRGDWVFESITTNNAAIPSFSAKGDLIANAENVTITGTFTSEDETYKGDFTLDYTPSENPAPILNSNIQVDMSLPSGSAKMPLAVEWVIGEPMRVNGSNGAIHWEQGELALNIDALALDLTQNENGFSGNWSSDTINLTAPVEVPTLKGQGKINTKGAAITVSGLIKSPDESWLIDFTLALGHEKASENGLRFNRARMPWNKGRISVDNVWLPFATGKAVQLDIQAEKVDLADLMSTLTGDRIKARGLVSGHIPLSIKPDGSISVDGGNLGAEGPGTITMPPETIPANNEQVNLVKDIMEDLHYEVLNISAEPDPDGELAIKLTVEGKNPKVLDGHPVKLNINLTGNLVEFLEQNLMLLTRPETLLKREQD